VTVVSLYEGEYNRQLCYCMKENTIDNSVLL
jgi:hypothetical protein